MATWLALVVAASLAGCAALHPRASPATASNVTRSASSPAVATCLDTLRTLDDAVEAHARRDALARRVPGYPFLRSTRLWAAMAEQARVDSAAGALLLERLFEEDQTARRFEITNLPIDAWPVGAWPSAQAAQTKLDACRQPLLDHARRAPPNWIDALEVPDDYLSWQRAVGAYAVTRVPFLAGVRRWEASVQSWFDAQPSPASTTTPWSRWTPLATPPSTPNTEVSIAQWGDAWQRDALGLVMLTAAQRAMLTLRHAPKLEIPASGADFDRPGTITGSDALTRHPRINTTQATVDVRWTHTRIDQQWWPQIVYTFWFSERPLNGPLDILGGPIDGLVWRVTLGHGGRPLIYDSMHPCGCYHLFFPVAGLVRRDPPARDVEWALVPRTLPLHERGAQVTLRVAGRTHDLIDVQIRSVAPSPSADQDRAARPPTGQTANYALRDDDALRSLPTDRGQRASVFDSAGHMRGTERGERWLFWPMGIHSPGAMRQWGRHATAFVGRRHFDDPALIDDRFVSVTKD